jgi:hypothetical protein
LLFWFYSKRVAINRTRRATKLLSIGRLLQWARKVAKCAVGYLWFLSRAKIRIANIPVDKRCNFVKIFLKFMDWRSVQKKTQTPLSATISEKAFST